MTTRSFDLILVPDIHANRPASAPKGALFPCTTHNKIYRYDGAAWQDWRGNPALSSLSDVDMTGLANGNVPVWDSASSKWKPGSGGAGSSPRTMITDVLLSSTAASIVFSSIPGTYDDLEVEIEARSSTASSAVPAYLYCNGDTTSGDYDGQRMLAQGSSGFFNAGQTYQIGYMAGASSLSNEFGTMIIRIPRYKDTTIAKSYRTISTLAGSVCLAGNIWKNTGAITSLTVAPGSGVLAIGTRVRLYGLKDI